MPEESVPEQSMAAANVCVCLVSLVGSTGTVLLLICFVWMMVDCHSRCGCTADRCCEWSASCPDVDQCLCSSDSNDWLKGTCESSSYYCGDHHSTIQSMLQAGTYMFMAPLMVVGLLLVVVLFQHLASKVKNRVFVLGAAICRRFTDAQRETGRQVPDPDEQSCVIEAELAAVQPSTAEVHTS